MKKILIVAGLVGVGALAANAQTDATAITTAVSSAFTGVATLCVSIGTFFLVYRMVKKIR